MESTGNVTETKLLGNFQYVPTSATTAGAGTWTTVLAGEINVLAHFTLFNVPISYRQLYRFNNAGYEPSIDIDLPVAPEAFTAFLIFRHVKKKKKTTTTVARVSHEQKIESGGEDGYNSKLSQLQQQQIAATTTQMEYYSKIPDDDTKENTDQLTKSFMDIPTQKQMYSLSEKPNQSPSQISTHITPTIAPAIHEAPDMPYETHPRGPQTYMTPDLQYENHLRGPQKNETPNVLYETPPRGPEGLQDIEDS
ncbi:hypothetical protein BGW41_001471 [Actinomortierella wolfii]|nr:hypothetical protein BGW41_001471 [Actinomortierella wolfii]